MLVRCISLLICALTPGAAMSAGIGQTIPLFSPSTCLSDANLAAVYGAQSGNGVERLARDPGIRSTIPTSVVWQQMDAWWADSGSVLIAANVH